jgi:hypothetical protein
MISAAAAVNAFIQGFTNYVGNVTSSTPPRVTTFVLINDPLPELSVTINHYSFTLISKLVIFDRRYVNFNITNTNGVTTQHTAYASSSQVGAWRLCMRKGNSLDKFDDYVQSTLLHWRLSKLICDNFYSSLLKWDYEPNNAESQYGITCEQRNSFRNDAAAFQAAFPVLFDQAALDGAVDMAHVIDGIGLLEYRNEPLEYMTRTEPNPQVIHLILGRGVGELDADERARQVECNYRHLQGDNPPHEEIPAPCPFNYWTEPIGHCGSNSNEGIWIGDELVSATVQPNLFINRFTQNSIKWHLKQFSDQIMLVYDIESLINNRITQMKITELYSDCMSYKNFVQRATIYNVKLIVNPSQTLCLPGIARNVNLIYAHYTIKQWRLEPNVQIIPEPEPDYPSYIPNPPIPQTETIINPNIRGIINATVIKESQILPDLQQVNVQGFYIMTILPEKKINYTPVNGFTFTDNVSTGDPSFFPVNEIGLYIQYIKGGYFVCKPLDYESQCDPGPKTKTKRKIDNISKINENYLFIGDRYNFLYPIINIYNFLNIPIKSLSGYKEQILLINNEDPNGLPRSITLRSVHPNATCIVELGNDIAEREIRRRVTRQAMPAAAAMPAAMPAATVVGVKKPKIRAGAKTKTKKSNKKRKTRTKKSNKKRKTYKRKVYR